MSFCVVIVRSEKRREGERERKRKSKLYSQSLTNIDVNWGVAHARVPIAPGSSAEIKPRSGPYGRIKYDLPIKTAHSFPLDVMRFLHLPARLSASLLLFFSAPSFSFIFFRLYFCTAFCVRQSSQCSIIGCGSSWNRLNRLRLVTIPRAGPKANRMNKSHWPRLFPRIVKLNRATQKAFTDQRNWIFVQTAYYVFTLLQFYQRNVL